ncbi:hypothetical protein C4D60_Mb01t33380 [Musa balbisiana]|uniref:CBF1-interacting co-repressor CIR N-terminal domain-containing protein n=1 Tax=Musa balbisiana TaxID=52838 RepID=A0A4S8JSJ1_MUSBA|nr:hypothetical protein C4D60_Mb01t33380 [Musa balbisiana]
MLEDLRKQIQDERENSEFRLLQEQAIVWIDLIRRQERLDFLYESGLAVGKGSSDRTFWKEDQNQRQEGRRDQEGQEKDRTRGDREGFLEDEMALKFLNKKGWHTESLRNIENVWKAKQKHEAE